MVSGNEFKIPPVCWFERLVNCALNGYLSKAVALTSSTQAAEAGKEEIETAELPGN
jgi:hypothetical protein